MMNRNLVLFSVLLIMLGIGSGFYLLSLLGSLFLLPALISRGRPPPARATPPQKQEARRIIPLTPPQPPAEAAPPQVSGYMASPQPAQYQGYSMALFPTTMFPSLSQMGGKALPPVQPPVVKQDARDDLVEVGAMIALLKLAFG
ncbi:MAG: hypothetical protein JRM80_02520 [Nitrososphaerota archaeon]|nr:hypothetical protein [Nitrososphaerota archaeon]